jgi:hypothetical protein
MVIQRSSANSVLNALSWTSLTVPLAVILWTWLYRRQ